MFLIFSTISSLEYPSNTFYAVQFGKSFELQGSNLNLHVQLQKSYSNPKKGKSTFNVIYCVKRCVNFDVTRHLMTVKKLLN